MGRKIDFFFVLFVYVVPCLVASNNPFLKNGSKSQRVCLERKSLLDGLIGQDGIFIKMSRRFRR